MVKVRLEFKLLSATKIAGGYLLKLSLGNVGSRILKSLVVRLDSEQKGFSDCAGCFIYALMPNANNTISFKVFVTSLARFYFSVSGYASGDTYFSVRSPTMMIKSKDAENNVLLI